MKDYTLAKVAYDAYCANAGGVSLVTGDKLPEFDVLTMAVKNAWWAAVHAVLSRTSQGKSDFMTPILPVVPGFDLPVTRYGKG